MKNLKQHWEDLYGKRADNEVSWFQENPITSLNLIKKYCSESKDKSIIDVGGGNSRLITELVKMSLNNLSVLDISKEALERSRQRIPSAPVKWIESSILDFHSEDEIYLWHDRAVFHFLITKEDIDRYVRIAKQSILMGGYLILATFSETGPKICSGLPIAQYSKSRFCQLFEPEFQMLECFEEVHHTPFDTEQNFIWIVFKRTSYETNNS
jgi:2-polyprenyl-3-methyl-5-hydroxy-6-metoxy-1,4-benzoquinol methylase